MRGCFFKNAALRRGSSRRRRPEHLRDVPFYADATAIPQLRQVEQDRRGALWSEREANGLLEVSRSVMSPIRGTC